MKPIRFSCITSRSVGWKNSLAWSSECLQRQSVPCIAQGRKRSENIQRDLRHEQAKIRTRRRFCFLLSDFLPSRVRFPTLPKQRSAEEPIHSKSANRASAIQGNKKSSESHKKELSKRQDISTRRGNGEYGPKDTR